MGIVIIGIGLYEAWVLNRRVPVVILLATLFTNGSPPSIPVG